MKHYFRQQQICTGNIPRGKMKGKTKQNQNKENHITPFSAKMKIKWPTENNETQKNLKVLFWFDALRQKVWRIMKNDMLKDFPGPNCKVGGGEWR